MSEIKNTEQDNGQVESSQPVELHGHWISRLTEVFLHSKLVIPIIAASLLLGIMAVWQMPKEEEPQIVVPMVDIMVEMPGADAPEIETRVVQPMERLLWEIPGVEYVYSQSHNGSAMTIVRYYVGEDTERSIVKTYDKLYRHLDWIPPGCSNPILKSRSINDIPVLSLALWSSETTRTTEELRELAVRLNQELRSIPGVAQTEVIGGARRELLIQPDPERLRKLGLDVGDVHDALVLQNRAGYLGTVTRSNDDIRVTFDQALRDSHDVEQVMLGLKDGTGQTVLLRDVAAIKDAGEEPRDYVKFTPGPSSSWGEIVPKGESVPAVNITLAKRAGYNAYELTQKIREHVELLKGFTIPDDVHVSVLRDFGETANEKVNELLKHLLLATLSVGLIIMLFLGGRAAAVVLVAVPVTLALTLAIYWGLGYTLNRVTLFALIFCIGIIVDDPIVDVENIVRHLKMKGADKIPFTHVISAAVNEVRAPLILATITVIVAIMPMAFVGGLMGPYMRPMPIGASLAMFMSMAVAFIITPWVALQVLNQKTSEEEPDKKEKEALGTGLYRKIMTALLEKPKLRWSILGGVCGLLLLSVALVWPLRVVPVKMLPFDNKSEIQLLLKMPEGTALEETARVADVVGQSLMKFSEVTDWHTFVGAPAPMTFNGLVRHYYMRQSPELADITVRLKSPHERKLQSHDLAKLIRKELAPVAKSNGAVLQVVEMPPGPPVMQTLVAEVYGPSNEGRLAVAKQLHELFEQAEGVVDVDWYVSDPQPESRIRLQPDKARQNGVDPARVENVLRIGLDGATAGLLHQDNAGEDIPVRVRLAQQLRTSTEDLRALPVRGERPGQIVSLGEVSRNEVTTAAPALYRKNLLPVIYVTADVAGGQESPVYAMESINAKIAELGKSGTGAWVKYFVQTNGQPKELPQYYTKQPENTTMYSMKWDGEWATTYEVFRDMGIAFAVVCLMIYMLAVGWFGSYIVPLAIVVPIPLSLIGIIPAHAGMGAFFTATSMIGFIAGAGIVVRNSIILVDFIQLKRSQGFSLEHAVVEAGAVRFRPMLLTAMAVIAGSAVILFDPIFQGLAISLMSGEIAATLFSRMIVPIMYFLVERDSVEEQS